MWHGILAVVLQVADSSIRTKLSFIGLTDITAPWMSLYVQGLPICSPLSDCLDGNHSLRAFLLNVSEGEHP